MHSEVTVVVGIDAKTIQQLAISCETWRLHRPEMWSMPWVLFWDWTKPYGISREELEKIERQLAVPNLRTVQWPSSGSAPKHAYESQRECMLSGHVWVPGTYVETDWSLKLDTDVLALRKSDWLQPAWFEDCCDPAGGECDANCEPRYIAPGWNYTKGVNYLGRLEEWGDAVNFGPHGIHPRLGIPFDPTHLRVPHKRMCSWVSFYNVSWLRWLCRELGRTVGNGRLPVPSQDTTVWYAAERERNGPPDDLVPGCYRHVNMKKLGWGNFSKLGTLTEVAKQVLSGQEAIVDA
jgi:hypothetical protein